MTKVIIYRNLPSSFTCKMYVLQFVYAVSQFLNPSTNRLQFPGVYLNAIVPREKAVSETLHS